MPDRIRQFEVHCKVCGARHVMVMKNGEWDSNSPFETQEEHTPDCSIGKELDKMMFGDEDA